MSDSSSLTAEQFDHIKKIIQSAVLSIESAETEIHKAKSLLTNIQQLGGSLWDLSSIVDEIKKTQTKVTHTPDEEDWQVVYGEFDGYFMLGEDLKKYPVPLNYSSKSKLVPWDKLKLTVNTSWQLLYKLIEPCERKYSRAVLSKDDTDTMKYIAISADWQNYQLNQAAVTFFKWHIGDEIYIITNKAGKGNYAAIEAVIKS